MISLPKTSEASPPHTRKQAVGEPSASRVVPKPIPESQAQNPREYQMEQLQKRYSPKESRASDGATSFLFKLAPSDPDFPFELAHLECDIRVPRDYPEERPVLFVKNKDIPRGFSINIERGWERLVDAKKGATLLALTRELDKNLEGFLSEQKVETVKLVAFQDVKDTRHLDAQTQPAVQSTAEQLPKAAPAPRRPLIREESFTKEQIEAAKARRAQETRQLQSRMGRLPLYRKSADGVVYTLPLEPRRRPDLLPGLQAVKSVHFIIPMLYPLQKLRIQLNDVDSQDAEPVEDLFCEKAAELQQMPLTSLLNYLAQNLASLSKKAQEAASKVDEPQVVSEESKGKEVNTEGSTAQTSSGDKSHIQVIPRPPEWGYISGDEESQSDDWDSSEGEGGAALSGEEEKEEEVAPREQLPGETPERGTMITFPSIELHGIELFQVAILSITVKCERCKTLNDVTGLKPDVEKTISCKKCATPLAAKFRQQLVHELSTRAGFLDLSGCKVSEMQPSTFVPTCARCSTAGFGIVSVRGDAVTNVCRECHNKFTFKIPEVKFHFITPGSLPPPTAGPRRRQEKLGLHAGDPLPEKGSCSHYRKSYRWFRFSCCSRVHPCDKCHDQAEDHINEWANRMICGWCSREQNYAVDECGFCGRSVIGKKGRGFWEGGKGTRDRKLMSRKDPRKFKRIGGTQAAKKE